MFINEIVQREVDMHVRCKIASLMTVFFISDCNKLQKNVEIFEEVFTALKHERLIMGSDYNVL